MKRLGLLLILPCLPLLSGCGKPGPKDVVRRFMDAMQAGEAEKAVPLWVIDKRFRFEKLLKEDPKRFKQTMVLIYDGKKQTFRDATIGQPIIHGDEAAVRVRGPAGESVFLLYRESDGWRVVSFGVEGDRRDE